MNTLIEFLRNNVFIPLHASGSVSLPTVGDGFIDGAIAIIQRYVNFSTGAIATMLVAIAIVLGMGIWYFSPREGIVGIVLRIVAVGIGLLNIPLIITAFRF